MNNDDLTHPTIERRSGYKIAQFIEMSARPMTGATIAGLILQGFGVIPRVTAIICSLIFLALIILMRIVWRPAPIARWSITVRQAVPLIFSLSLLCVLLGTLLHQHQIATYSVDVGEETSWFKSQLSFCNWFHVSQTCLAEKVSRLSSVVHAKNDSPSEQLFADQAIGEILRNSTEVQNLLGTMYGVGASFTGTGLSVPLNGRFQDERVPEFLIPNYPQRQPGIVIWQVDPLPDKLATPLSEFIKSETPSNVTKERRDDILREARVGISDPLSAVVRFAKVSTLSGCLGRKERKRVFASHLGVALAQNLTIADAAQLSGYQINPQQPEQKFYLFVFVPSAPQEILVPTWRAIASQVAPDQNMPSPCR